MKKIVLQFILLSILYSVSFAKQKESGDKPLNIVMIAIDDMNNWVGKWEGRAFTPNIDQLANDGVQFRNAHCVVPACNPSRVALLTGLRPETTGQYTNEGNFRDRENGANLVTLPQFLMSKGYETIEAGKIFHKQAGTGHTPHAQSDPQSWSYQYKTPTGTPGHNLYLDSEKHAKWLMGSAEYDGIPYGEYLRKFAVWGAIPEKREECGDWMSAEYCAEYLQEEHDKPFLLSCGIFRPHSPQLAPQKYFDMYPLDEIELPEIPENDMDDIPKSAQSNFSSGIARKIKSDTLEWKKAIQAYKACMTFADDCVGHLLESLENSDYADNTIVLFWTDHGWQLGHKDRWEKFSLWNQATNAPMIIKLPNQQNGGKVTEHVSFLDIYPTIVDLLGYKQPKALQGHSLKHLIEEPTSTWDYAAVTTYNKGNVSVKKGDWNYITYNNGDSELYNLQNDPLEYINLATDEQYIPIIEELKAYLPK